LEGIIARAPRNQGLGASDFGLRLLEFLPWQPYRANWNNSVHQ
jgi:hypothetical protein